MSQPTLDVFDIQRLSWHDGPGIRSVVFLKGCNLRCFWCHNPESQAPGAELLYYAEYCIGCGRCVSACAHECHSVGDDGEHRLDRTNCARCGACVEACYADALRMSGRTMTVDAVAEEVLKDREYYRSSNGGVTLSGGEPLLQAESCRALLDRLREAEPGIGTAVDTAGHVPWTAFEAILSATDYVLFDIKTMNADRHLAATGVTNRFILSNLRRLKDRDVRLIVRIPIVPGFNDDVGDMRAVAGELGDYPNLEKIELLPFHSIGETKYRVLGRPYQAHLVVAPGPDLLERLKAVVRSNGDAPA